MGTGRGKGEREEAKRSEGELMEESFGSGGQVTHQARVEAPLLPRDRCLSPPSNTSPAPMPPPTVNPTLFPKKTVQPPKKVPHTGCPKALTHCPLPVRLLDCSVNARPGVECRGARRAPEFHLVATCHPPNPARVGTEPA